MAISGIKRLKSKLQPPWGAGITVDLTHISNNNLSSLGINLLLRFFTVNTTTEVGKMILPCTGATTHLVFDATNTITSANSSSEATAITLANELKTDLNAHFASTTHHSNADGTNTITSANASDLASAITLANEIKGDYNAHRTQATVHPHNDTAWIITSANATDQTSVNTLLNELKADYNNHRIATSIFGTGYGISPGTYDVGVGAYGCINALIEDVVFVAGATTTVNDGIAIGDVDGSGDIDLVDVLIPNGDTFGFSDEFTTGDTRNWLVPEQTELGVWTVTSTARRRTY